MKPLQPDSPGDRIVTEELRLLARVNSALGAISGQTVGAPDFDAELIDLRDQIGEAKPEDIPALVEQMTRLSAIAQRYGKGRDLPVDPQVPYFAHMRLREHERRRDVLIGKRGFIDRRYQVNIVDWRNAPVSRIYYRYEEEDDYEEHFGERTLEGTVEIRRNLTIDAGQLRRVGAPQGTYARGADGEWFEAEPVTVSELSGGQGTAARPPRTVRGHKGSRLGLHHGPRLRADKHLPEIAALIDREQFDLITQLDSGLVVLQGGAGTGKTTVALHRVAYLNYQRPKLFRSDRILVVVPSRAMARYVEGVLPSLGVRGVRVVTARVWFERTRQKALPDSTKRYNDDTPSVVQRFKKHPMLIPLFSEFVARQELELTQQLAAAQQSPQDDGIGALLRAWHDRSGEPLIPRIAGLRAWIADQRLSALDRQRAESVLRRLKERAEDLLADWAEVLTDRQLLGDAVTRHCPEEFTNRQLDQICGWCTRQSIDIGSKRASVGGDGLDDDVEEHVAADGLIEQVEEEAGRLDAADDALLLYLCLLKRGALRAPGGKTITHEHIVVDEAQDLAAVELKVLLDTTRPRHSVTLAGDTAQRLVFDNAFAGWEPLLEQLGMPVTSNTTLQLGYRSTVEVMELAREILGDAVAAPAPRSTRHGAPVEIHQFADQGQAVAMLAEALRSLALREPLASVALIARHPAQAIAYGEALRRAEVPAVRIVRDQDFSFRPGIEVTDVMQVKGLEFDYVILLDVTAANYPATIEARHLLHIAATRAAYQLWIITVGQPCPLLPHTH